MCQQKAQGDILLDRAPISLCTGDMSVMKSGHFITALWLVRHLKEKYCSYKTQTWCVTLIFCRCTCSYHHANNPTRRALHSELLSRGSLNCCLHIAYLSSRMLGFSVLGNLLPRELLAAVNYEHTRCSQTPIFTALNTGMPSALLSGSSSSMRKTKFLFWVPVPL